MGDFKIVLIENSNEQIIPGPFELDLRDLGVDMTDPIRYVYYNADYNVPLNPKRFTVDLNDPVLNPYKGLEGDPSIQSLVHKNPRMVIFTSTAPSDIVRGILHSFDTAYPQIPDGGPGIIYIELNPNTVLNPVNPIQAKMDMALIESRIKSKLNIVSRVNSVVLTASTYYKSQGGASYAGAVFNIKNTKPAHPIADELLDSICRLKLR